jgi:hypothetical protein
MSSGWSWTTGSWARRLLGAHGLVGATAAYLSSVGGYAHLTESITGAYVFAAASRGSDPVFEAGFDRFALEDVDEVGLTSARYQDMPFLVAGVGDLTEQAAGVRARLLPLLSLLLPSLSGCKPIIRELSGPFDIAKQRVGSASVEGTGFIDMSEEEGSEYAFGQRYEPAGERFIAILDPPIQTDASRTSLDMDEDPVIGLTHDGQELSFAAEQDEDGEITLVAADPWGTGDDLELLLER